MGQTGGVGMRMTTWVFSCLQEAKIITIAKYDIIQMLTRKYNIVGDYLTSSVELSWYTQMYTSTRRWWRYQMETVSALLALCAGNHQSPVNSPHKGQWHGVLMFSLICAWINGWVNNREAGDLRRHRTHYDVTVMSKRRELSVSQPSMSLVTIRRSTQQT